MWYVVIVLHNFLFTKFPTVFDGFLGEFYRLPFNQIAFNEFVFLDCARPEYAASWYSIFFRHQFHLLRQPLSYDSVLRQPLVLGMIIAESFYNVNYGLSIITSKKFIKKSQ